MSKPIVRTYGYKIRINHELDPDYLEIEGLDPESEKFEQVFLSCFDYLLDNTLPIHEDGQWELRFNVEVKAKRIKILPTS